jgi:DNA polymerase alpha subunit B
MYLCLQVDFRHAKHWQMSSHSPDVLIMPSKLTPMAKSVHSTLVVNPGFLAKGTAGGSYADICIHPIAENTLREGIAAANADDAADDGGMLHNVVSRSYVNVVKI